MVKILFIGATLFLLSGCTIDGFENRTTPTWPTPSHNQEEIAHVRRNRYDWQPILNYSERKLYWKLINQCSKNKNGIVFAQVSLGEILQHKDYSVYKDVNSKRCDFCITDRNFNPVAVIEYHGEGHYGETSNLRDTVKRNAVESAGLLYFAITPNNIDNQLQEIWQQINFRLGNEKVS